VTEPVWVSRAVVIAIHARVLADHGGASGLRDSGLLDAALARPRQIAGYDDPDRYGLAAAYAGGLLRNHPFVDGNKRVGLLTAYVFLARNGIQLAAPEADAARATLALAAGEMDEKEFAEWLRRNGAPTPPSAA